MTIGEFFGLVIFALLVYGAYSWAKDMKGSRKSKKK